MRRFLLTTLLLALAGPAAAQEVSYRREVRAILTRGGCSQGACHGNLNGKGGFKLSLRGENPEFDHRALVRDAGGRRIASADPDASLLLLKAAGRTPHEGGVRFPVDSDDYRTIRRWIAEGASDDADRGPTLVALEVTPREAYVSPALETQVRATARFSDGTTRDVGALAAFDSSNPEIAVERSGRVVADRPGEASVVVRYLDLQATARIAFVPHRPDYRWTGPAPAGPLDEAVFAQLQKLKLTPSAPASDGEFLRRAYHDVAGILPTPEEARRFFADTSPDRRERVVDGLLARPEFADWWALKWADVLRVEEKALDKKGVKAFHGWIRDSLAADKPLPQFARELLVAQGSTYDNPPANFYRSLREPAARSEATAQVFLGVRMQCAKCHNHPFDRWTQDEYHRLAAFFARVQYRIVENNRRDKLDKHEFVGEQIVYQDADGETKHPVSGATLAPGFLGAPSPKLGAKDDRLTVIAAWVADPKNPFFARTQANRIWAHLTGRGLVDPTDDFRASNPPTNEALLDALTRTFVAGGSRLKPLVRAIVLSRTYQFSSRPNETNADDETHHSRALIRPLGAEALLDAVASASGAPIAIPGLPAGVRAVQAPSLPSLRRGESQFGAMRFLKAFGKPERLLSCDCERSDASTLTQALALIAGDLVNDAIARPDNRVGKLLERNATSEAIVEELYLAALTRLPTADERGAFVARLDRVASRRHAAEDLLWALVNSKEFLLRR